ncbi:MAG: F0F1 ATP synthase subunit B [Candidatus Xenobia bacterium]
MEKLFQPFTVLVQIVNFILLYFLVLKPLVFKPLMQAMSEREAMVKKTLDEADSINAQAKSLKAQYDAKLKEAATEATSIVQSSQKEGEKLKAELVEQGRKESQRLLEKANTEIALEKSKAISELRAQVAGLAVAMARQLLTESLDADTQKALVEQMTKKAARLSA